MKLGEWWWLSWQSGSFGIQRSAVQILASANFYLHIVHLNRKKVKNTEKEARNGPSLKKSK